MAVWFTADQHFGHTNIIKHCARPFACADEMDAALITNWNAKIRPSDEVWHLGDLAFRSASNPGSYLERLNGRKHLVWGNHDRNETRKLAGWTSSQPLAEIVVEDTRLVLCHYAMRVWNRSHYRALHLYGHSHGALPGDRQSLDVGVDCWNFYPVSLADIKQRMETLPPRATGNGSADE